MAGAVLELRDLGLCEDLPCGMGWDGMTGAAASREQRARIQWNSLGFHSAADGSCQLLVGGQQSPALQSWWHGKIGEV